MIVKEYKPTRHQIYMMNKHSRYQRLLLSIMRFERQNDGLPEVKLINGKKKHRCFWEYNDNQKLYSLSRRLQKSVNRVCLIQSNSYYEIRNQRLSDYYVYISTF